MNYQVRRRGENLGVFSLEELRRRRESGELTGDEYIQREGASDWQPLDLVLQHGWSVAPPPLPVTVSTDGPNQTFIWLAIVAGVILCLVAVVAFGIFVGKVQQHYLSILSQSRARQVFNGSRPEAIAAASKPIVWTTNTLTQADANKRAREFRLRQWLDGYEKRGQHNPACDAEIEQFIRVWIDTCYDGPEATNISWLENESDKLANDPNCTDPLALTVAADESLNQFQMEKRFERALAAYPTSLHMAYPKFYATVRLAAQLGERSDRTGALETSALELLPECFADGSFMPADQQEIGEIFVNDWGYNFFYRNADSVCKIAHEAGPNFRWLALTLDGEREINEAWAARGNGYADTVTDAGLKGFNAHLAIARSDMTEAWNLHPNWPLVPERMIYVSLGDSDITEMRTWFDRTTTAQIDYPRAWSDLRWGLRPRWYGNEDAMLALGKMAVATGRFDTDVPRKFIDCIYDVESEMDLPTGQHIFGRADIWPDLEKMYDGYINWPRQKNLNGWRTSYAIVAWFAGKYDVARTQLEALNWKPLQQNMSGWSVDLSLMPLEVAARTGPLGGEISNAENAREAGDISGALKRYSALGNSPAADARTKEFIQCRVAELAAERRLQKGGWIDFLPSSDNDPNWVFSFGKAHRLPDGALEVESGPKGHMLYSRTRVGANFEVRGQFEVVRSSNKNFQAGIVMGVPDFDGYNWYGFRIKRHDVEGDVVCLGLGWSRRQITGHTVLNNVTNSFDFILQNGKVTASVNGVEIFHQAAPPVEIGVPDNSYLLGLGAFNDSADTVIRYRNVQVRKL
jgi:GYF domain 2